METKFSYKIKFDKQLSLSKFIDHILDINNANKNELTSIEIINSSTDISSFKKTTEIDIELPKLLLSMFGLKKLEIEEYITINNGNYESRINAPKIIESKLKFTEKFTIIEDGSNIKGLLEIEGINYLPHCVKKIAENFYINKRKERILSLFNTIIKNNCSTIQ